MRRRVPTFGAVLLVACLGCNPRLPDADSPGARLYAERCGGCHRLYAPGLMTEEMWRITVKRMQGELVRRGLPPLDREEETVLLDYLRAHSYAHDGKPA
jgi:hypothetical protein